MGLVRVSDSLDDEINCLGVDARFIYASSKNTIYAFIFGRKVFKVYKGHDAVVHKILPFASQLISIDEDNVMKVWDVETSDVYLSMQFPRDNFEITCLMHPITYLNKILLASRQGSMQLWNIKSSHLIYSFKSFNSPVTILKQVSKFLILNSGPIISTYFQSFQSKGTRNRRCRRWIREWPNFIA